MNVCDANRVSRFESRARYLVDGEGKGRIGFSWVWFSLWVSTTREAARKGRGEKERGDD